MLGTVSDTGKDFSSDNVTIVIYTTNSAWLHYTICIGCINRIILVNNMNIIITIHRLEE